MFRDTKAFSSFSVDDLDKAWHFYSEVLGLEVTREEYMLHLHISGGGRVLLYHKPNHVPATFTVLHFPVPVIEKAVADLKQMGVLFESYTGSIQTDENNISRYGKIKNAWFTDPAGNILSVVEG